MTSEIKWKNQQVAALLKLPKVGAELKRRADLIHERAGGDAKGFESDLFLGKRRWRASVSAVSPHARRGEAKDRRLTKAIEAGRG